MSDIAIDTSAIVEVMIEGPQAETVREALRAASLVLVTPIARLEAAMIMIGRFGWDRSAFDRAWRSLGAQEVPIDTSVGSLAIDAFELWGKGRAEAGLNFGDCFSHALAVARDVPLLYVGDDFSKTDLQKA